MTGIAVQGDFLQSNNCGQRLAAQGKCAITVTFNPTALGYATGTLTLTHDGATVGACAIPEAGGANEPRGQHPVSPAPNAQRPPPAESVKRLVFQ